MPDRADLKSSRPDADFRLGCRHAKKFRVKDEEFRVAELILGRHLTTLELTLLDDPITDEVISLHFDAEVGGPGPKRTIGCPDCDAMGAGSKVEHAMAHRRIG